MGDIGGGRTEVKGWGEDEGKERGGKERARKEGQTFSLLQHAIDGARAAGTGHFDVEFVVVGW